MSRSRQLLAAGALLTVVGIAIAGTAPVLGTDGASRTVAQQAVGGVMVVLGWALFGFAIHSFGRSSEGD